jgi:hypothetical protein
LGLGAAGYAGTKLAQKAFGDCIKKNKKKDKEAEDIWTRNKIDRKKSGLSNIEISDIMKNEKNFRGVFAIDMLPKKIRKDESAIINFQCTPIIKVILIN